MSLSLEDDTRAVILNSIFSEYRPMFNPYMNVTMAGGVFSTERSTPVFFGMPTGDAALLERSLPACLTAESAEDVFQYKPEGIWVMYIRPERNYSEELKECVTYIELLWYGAGGTHPDGAVERSSTFFPASFPETNAQIREVERFPWEP